jgi:hypothetical protein
MDDLARDPDQPVRRSIAVADIAWLEDRRGMLNGLSPAVVVHNFIKVEISASKIARDLHLMHTMKAWSRQFSR